MPQCDTMIEVPSSSSTRSPPPRARSGRSARPAQSCSYAGRRDVRPGVKAVPISSGGSSNGPSCGSSLSAEREPSLRMDGLPDRSAPGVPSATSMRFHASSEQPVGQPSSDPTHDLVSANGQQRTACEQDAQRPVAPLVKVIEVRRRSPRNDRPGTPRNADRNATGQSHTEHAGASCRRTDRQYVGNQASDAGQHSDPWVEISSLTPSLRRSTATTRPS